MADKALTSQLCHGCGENYRASEVDEALCERDERISEMKKKLDESATLFDDLRGLR